VFLAHSLRAFLLTPSRLWAQICKSLAGGCTCVQLSGEPRRKPYHEGEADTR
jgi:hypothetical protein